jgi:protein-tyrosine phosphatase
MLKRIKNKMFSPTEKKKLVYHTVDVHSHLLPNLDDGVQSLEESVEIITRLVSLGFKKIVTTPHVMKHRFPNARENIYSAYLLLQKTLSHRKVHVELEVAAEYYYDEHFLDLINKNELLTFGDNYVLFELSYKVKPFMLEQTIAKLIDKGYKPVLAHPERYGYYNKQEHYETLKDMGLYFQINMNSTQGFYGSKVQKAVEKIIDLGVVDFIGSDIHSHKYTDSFVKSLKGKIYSQIFAKNQIKNDML